MRDWLLLVAVNPDADEPLYVQIAQQMLAAVLDGRLHAGTALPGSRTLARELGVHRNTVLAAYDELYAQGWLRTAPARGTFVADDLSLVPQLMATRASRAGAARRGCVPDTKRAGFPVPPPAPMVQPPAYRPGQLVLSRGAPDVALFPRSELARAYRRVVDRLGPAALTYADPRGHPALREALADMLATRRALRGGAETVMVTRGSQMAVCCSCRVCCGRVTRSPSRS